MSADGDCIHAIIWGQQVGDGHQEECCCWWRGRYSGWTPTSTCTHMKSKAKTKTRTATSSSTWFADLKSKTKTKNKKGGTKAPHDWKIQLITTPSNLSVFGPTKLSVRLALWCFSDWCFDYLWRIEKEKSERKQTWKFNVEIYTLMSKWLFRFGLFQQIRVPSE